MVTVRGASGNVYTRNRERTQRDVCARLRGQARCHCGAAEGEDFGIGVEVRAVTEVAGGARQHVGEVADHRCGDALVGDGFDQCVAHVGEVDVGDAVGAHLCCRLVRVGGGRQDQHTGDQQPDPGAGKAPQRAQTRASVSKAVVLQIHQAIVPGAFVASWR